jgi:hypothetical protein
LSIDHKNPWQAAADPKASFFDLDNIAFSHLRCNSGEANRSKAECPAGHPYDEENLAIHGGERKCRTCKKEINRRHRNTDIYRAKRRKFPSYGRS